MADVPAKDSLKQEPTAKPETRKSGKPEQQAPSPDFAALIHAIKTQDRAYRREERREDNGQRVREWITIGLIALTFVAVCWQVYEMVQVYGPIRDQAIASGKQAAAAEKAADATARAADAATKQSEIATRQAENSEQALIQAQRAWVGPRLAKAEKAPIAGEDFVVSLEYANSGREPAREFIYDLDSFTVTVEEDQSGTSLGKINAFISKCIAMWKPGAGQVVYPSTGGLGSGYTLAHTIDKDKIDEDVVSGNKVVIFAGCFVYKTTKRMRRSSFCYFFNAKTTKPGNWNICENGHDAD